jgi:hypothetical protein
MQLKIEDHPLTKIMQHHCLEYDALRDNNFELSNQNFHRKYGLIIHCPEHWEVIKTVHYVVSTLPLCKVALVYSTTQIYRALYTLFGESAQYFSWHEVNTGIHAVQTDTRYIDKIKGILSNADLTFFLDPPSDVPYILDNVRGWSPGNLIILSGGMKTNV